MRRSGFPVPMARASAGVVAALVLSGCAARLVQKGCVAVETTCESAGVGLQTDAKHRGTADLCLAAASAAPGIRIFVNLWGEAQPCSIHVDGLTRDDAEPFTILVV